jgi:tetratricopeptide (TPR) repeat protein
MAQAVELFEQALSIDPRYANAWVALSVAYTNQAAAGLRPWDEGYALSREAALEALEIDADNALAYDRLCWIARDYDADLAAAAAHCSRALQLSPASDAIIGHAAVLTQSLGRLDEAIALHEYTVSRAPADARARHNLALAYYFADRLDDAERSIRKVLAMSRDYYAAHYRLGTILLLQDKAAAAREAFEQETDEAFRVKGRALAASALGEETEALAALAELESRWGGQWPSEVAHVYAFRGDKDKAFEWLETDYEVSGPAGWGEWRLMRLWDNLRDDPRWQAFLRKVGVSDEQLAAIEFEASVPGVKP